MAALDLPASLRSAHDLMTRLLVGTRLLAPDLAVPADAPAAILAKLCEADGFASLLDRFTAARQNVADQWQATFGETLEIEI